MWTASSRVIPEDNLAPALTDLSVTRAKAELSIVEVSEKKKAGEEQAPSVVPARHKAYRPIKRRREARRIPFRPALPINPGRTVVRDLNYFPEFRADWEGRSCMWLNNGTPADVEKAKQWAASQFDLKS